MTFRKPQSSDTMIDHAEQHGFIYDEVSKLQNDKADKDHIHDGIGNDYDDSWIEPELDQKSDITHTHSSYSDLNHTHDTSHTHTEYQPKGDYASDTHTHPPQDLTHNHDAEYAPVHEHPYASDTHDHDVDYAPIHDHPYAADDHTHDQQDLTHDHDSQYVNSNEDTDIKPNKDNPFITLNTRRFQEEDGTPTTREFGLEINLDEGNTYKNQFSVGSRHGYALKVLGGTGRETWFGGKVSQKGSSLENKDATDYIIRKNLNDAVEPLVGQIEHNEDRLNALETELDAIATNKEAGEWEMVSPLDFDVRGTGQMTLSTDDFTASNNTLTLHQTDINGVSHGFSGVEVGDLVEVVQEHIARSTGDYGLYEVTGVNGMSFTLTLQQGKGTADLNTNFFVKFFHLSEGIDIAELDARYSTKGHTHSYATVNHTHSQYAQSSHSHSDYASSNHTHSTIFRSGTSSSPSLSKGEPYLNTSLKVVYVGT